MKVGAVLIFCNFTLMLVIPTMVIYERAALLLASMVIGLVNMLVIERRRSISLNYFLIHFGICLTFSIPLLVGFVNGNPGVSDFFNVLIVYPTLYFIFSLILINNIIILEKALIFSAFINGFLGIMMLFSDYYFPFLLEIIFKIIGIEGYFGVGKNEVGMPEFVILGYVSLLYGTVLLLSRMLLMWWCRVLPHRSNIFLFIIFICVSSVVLSGQRSFFLGVFVSISTVFLVYYSYGLRNKLSFHSSALIIPSFLSIFFLCMVFYLILSDFNFNFDFYSDAMSLRQIQIDMFLSEFENNLLLGTGFGYVGNLIRSVEMPWAYETTYYLMIVSMGFIFSGILLIFIINIFYKSITYSVLDNSALVYFYPHFSAVLAVLVASYFNPFLFKFDSLWIFYIPVISWFSVKRGFYRVKY